MITVSMIPTKAKEYIQQQVQAFEKENKVRVILAIESGSRAWGFPSKDSDYDVRCIYVHPFKDNLSVRSLRDVIEADIVHDEALGVSFDFNGWDIRKALCLAIKSNPVLYEWFQSPIAYMVDEPVISRLRIFMQETASLAAFKNHYYNLANNAWVQIQETKDGVKIKRYCYALRPALALHWICRKNTVPPMDMHSLVAAIEDAALIDEIGALIAIKASAEENDIISRNSTFDAFIELVLKKKPRKIKEPIASESFEKADELFRNIIDR